MNDFSEKRKYPRVDTHLPVRYRKLGDQEGTLNDTTMTKNLSEGGMRFKAAEFISRACRLILEIDLPMISKPIRAISKVAWIKKTATGENFEIGNQFLEISKKDKELVSEYVDSLNLYNDDGNVTELDKGLSTLLENSPVENTDNPDMSSL